MEKTVTLMPLNESNTQLLRLCMALFAALALVIGLTFALQGIIGVALANFCGGLFFLFAYYNPNVLSGSGLQHFDFADIEQKKFLWTSLAIGLLAACWEFRVYIPLG